MSGGSRDRDYRDRPSDSGSRREEPRREERRREDYDDRRRDYDYDDRRRDYDDRRRDYDDRRDSDRRPAAEGDKYRSRDEPKRPEESRSSGRAAAEKPAAPAKASGGWGDEEPAKSPRGGSGGGGWGDDSAPKSKSSGGGGWGGDDEAPKPRAAAPAKPSSGGWGGDDSAPAKSSGGGGWGGDDGGSKSSGGDAWGAPAKSSGGDAWGAKSGGDDAWGASTGGDGGGDSWGGGGKSGGGGSGCRNCGEEGHFARECTQPRKSGGGGGSGCRNCGEEGHFARECTQPRKPRDAWGGAKSGGDGGEDAWGGEKSGATGGGGCRICGEEGHFAKECTKASDPDFVRPPRVDSPDDQCWRCGGMGHTAQNCSSRIECGNVPGRSTASKHNQLYTNDVEDDAAIDDAGLAAPSGEREDELFGTHINTGIQFSKYSEIKVEVYGENTPPPLKKFSDLELGGVLNNNLKLAKWDVPTPIQSYALPIGFNGRDIMGCAQTGSGKTAAFLFPIIHTLLQTPVTQRRGTSEGIFPGALIVVPVRELAQQIHIEAIKFTYRSNLRSVVIYGGSGTRDQRDALKRGCDILIGTPGRLLDFLKNGEYSLEKLKFLCFDEADRMLDLGFGEDMQVLLAKCPPTESRQTLMFSATFPEDVQEMAKSYLKADHVLITVGRVGAATPTVKQKVLYVEEPNKFDRLVDLFHDHPMKTLIFVGRKITAEELKGKLGSLGVPLETIHGDKDQYRREEALADFKAGKTKVLIATDVAARGLDIPAVGHVVNYDMPQNIDDYVHRIGRTGRVGHEGLATTFYNSGAYYLAAELVKILEEQGQEVDEWLTTDAQANPAGPRKVFQPKPKIVLAGNSGGGGDSWGSSGGNSGGGGSWGNSGGNSGGGGGDAWGSADAGGGSADPWGSSGGNNNSGGGGGGWGEESAPAAKSSGGGGGWGEESAPASSGGGGGWGEESAPTAKSPAKKSFGGGWGEEESAPAAKSSSGGWGEDESAPASSGGGGAWGDDAPAQASGGGGWGDDGGNSGW